MYLNFPQGELAVREKYLDYIGNKLLGIRYVHKPGLGRPEFHQVFHLKLWQDWNENRD